MAKSFIKIRARQMRQYGQSIKDIAKILHVSQSTASIWCRDIKLSAAQYNKLIQSKEKNITAGRLRGAFVQKTKRLNAIRGAQAKAAKLKKLTGREFFVSGIALYLAEGSKTSGTVQFTNSNPRIVNFMLNWFLRFYKIKRKDVRCSILINIIYEKRENKIKDFWQKCLKLSSEQFTKTRYVSTRQQKIYIDNNYFGTFNFRVRKSTRLLYLINAFSDRLLKINSLR